LNHTHEGAGLRSTKLLLVAFGAVTSLAIVDLAGDLRGGTTYEHAVVEGTIAIVGLVGLAGALRRFRDLSSEAAALRREAHELGERLGTSRAEADRWREQAGDLISGLSAAIDRQLRIWQLSDAEHEVALLLLKGLSHKEIAEIRNVGEATVRQQAVAIYRKAGLSGRRDLAAFFLEDLLGPRSANL
jgi:DNA-binding CsgD family transcriptional regulator